ncbi:MAG TPA: hypothetical protein ENM99_05420 [Desulfurella acetivorans]|uniref:Pilus assembly protein PilP n=1 Tax=Desulfurella acetivorans TaxID=33002 RepID=A0A7C6E999_DESAE|nr:hypothetical protein [Desulfurella acetivorans]
MKKMITVIVFLGIMVSNVLAFSVQRDPFIPLVKTQSAPLLSRPSSAVLQTQGPDFTLKMVMWGGLKGALLEDSNGVVYVAKEGSKIGQTQVVKIMPNKVLLKTPNGIKELSLKNPNNIVTQSKNPTNTSKNILDTSNKTLSSEVKP